MLWSNLRVQLIDNMPLFGLLVPVPDKGRVILVTFVPRSVSKGSVTIAGKLLMLLPSRQKNTYNSREWGLVTLGLVKRTCNR
jgi:hypothetical protein